MIKKCKHKSEFSFKMSRVGHAFLFITQSGVSLNLEFTFSQVLLTNNNDRLLQTDYVFCMAMNYNQFKQTLFDSFRLAGSLQKFKVILNHFNSSNVGMQVLIHFRPIYACFLINMVINNKRNGLLKKIYFNLYCSTYN